MPSYSDKFLLKSIDIVLVAEHVASSPSLGSIRMACSGVDDTHWECEGMACMNRVGGGVEFVNYGCMHTHSYG